MPFTDPSGSINHKLVAMVMDGNEDAAHVVRVLLGKIKIVSLTNEEVDQISRLLRTKKVYDQVNNQNDAEFIDPLDRCNFGS